MPLFIVISTDCSWNPVSVNPPRYRSRWIQWIIPHIISGPQSKDIHHGPPGGLGSMYCWGEEGGYY